MSWVSSGCGLRPLEQGLTLVPNSAQLELFRPPYNPTLAHERVLELLKLSSNVNEFEPLPWSGARSPRGRACREQRGWGEEGGNCQRSAGRAELISRLCINGLP
jgi:hypothetical protein